MKREAEKKNAFNRGGGDLQILVMFAAHPVDICYFRVISALKEEAFILSLLINCTTNYKFCLMEALF